MSDTADGNEGTSSVDQRQFPLGFSSRVFFVIVVVGTIIIPGLLVGLLETAGFSLLGNFVWILGYGTGIFIVWYLWLRPLDLKGAVEQDPRQASKSDTEGAEHKSDTGDDAPNSDS